MNGSYGSYILETFVTLLLVCVVAVVVLYGARRFGIGRARGPIELVGQLPLDARRSVYLVKVGAQVLVVGASEAGLTRLGELADGALPKDRARDAGGFRDVLARLRGESGERQRGDSAVQSREPEEPGVVAAKDPARPEEEP